MPGAVPAVPHGRRRGLPGSPPHGTRVVKSGSMHPPSHVEGTCGSSLSCQSFTQLSMHMFDGGCERWCHAFEKLFFLKPSKCDLEPGSNPFKQEPGSNKEAGIMLLLNILFTLKKMSRTALSFPSHSIPFPIE